MKESYKEVSLLKRQEKKTHGKAGDAAHVDCKTNEEVRGHTQGPWRIANRVSHGGVRFGRVSARIEGRRKGVELDYPVAAIYREDAGNASLIAAAPDLLEALEAIVNTGEGMPGWADAQDKAHAAIAKARGTNL